ncbi:type I DNA topoisomerase [Candidatus Gracilibacteria bacterium]|nr:type I DNA topoisomerase [Candidatus Gracilibacteria bacterium]MCF7819031.1 type I DNA topoisomerase [Candidatus Gracilibacteria bacterium]
MAKNLVIVESPAKAKTIEKFLGKDFSVKSSFGHIRDLPKKEMAIDIEHGFEPQYEISPDKKKTVTELRKQSKDAQTIWLATDEDREGEAIAWHLSAALKLEEKSTKRIVFHEITKPAILKAIENPRTIDKKLVDAQQARRVLDRLVGYELSPVLWKKVKTGLSAGRVQSVSVRLIVEREREIQSFKPESSFKITAEFDLGKGSVLSAELPTKFKTAKEAMRFLEQCVGAEFSVEDLEKKPGKKSPSPPFTTSTLQQEASRKLGFSVKQTMVVAQRLYESGKITYMRTDSLNLSDTALSQAAKQIESKYGKNFVQIRKYKTKSAGAQEAHEAIRPTDLSKESVSGDRNESRLYELIWKRTIASQMADAKIERTTATINISTRSEKLKAQGEVVQFEGFLKVYFEGTDEENGNGVSKILPPIKKGQPLALQQMKARQTFSRPPARYTEASLVKKMEEMGIGRPSTYAPTISTIQDRGYIEKGDREGRPRFFTVLTLKDKKVTNDEEQETIGTERGKLFPTDIGEVVNDFLVQYFPSIVDYDFTAKVEQEFDAIAQGKKKWNMMISEFYKPFHKTVEESAEIKKSDAQGMRELGTDPKTGKPVIVRIGRYGPMIQIGSADDEEKPRFSSLPTGKKMDDVTLEEALKMFELPRVLGKTKKGDEITANFGRFGPYVRYGKTFVSIKPEDPFSITLEKAKELIAQKEKQEAEKYIQTFKDSDIQVLNGRYGPYITDGTKNAKIPKDKEPSKLTLEECKELLEKAPAKGARRRFPRKK